MRHKIDRVVIDYREVGTIFKDGTVCTGPKVVIHRGLEYIKAYYNVTPSRLFELSRLANIRQSKQEVVILVHPWGWDFDVLSRMGNCYQ